MLVRESAVAAMVMTGADSADPARSSFARSRMGQPMARHRHTWTNSRIWPSWRRTVTETLMA